ncbi:MAG: branched-chain amino acid ABC transporter permease [Haloarculaceae archaeon]
MATLLTVLVQALIISALYALVAVGFTLIFGVGGVLNLAHGAAITIGAFAASIAYTNWHTGVAGAVAAAVLAPAVLGALLYLLIIRKFQDEPVIVMILTLGIAVAIETILLVIPSQTVRTAPVMITGTVTIGGASIQNNQFAMFGVSWLLLIGLYLWVTKTDTGRAILATSMDRKGAFLVGIDSGRINLLMWIVASALAGIAGYFLASQNGATWDMGQMPLIISFAIVIFGGLGSIRGSVVGAYVIGTLNVLTINYVDTRLAGLVPLLVLLAVLLVRPEGLFGQEVEAS